MRGVSAFIGTTLAPSYRGKCDQEAFVAPSEAFLFSIVVFVQDTWALMIHRD